MFLAVISPNWLDAKDEAGLRRLHHPDDFVAIEIAAALARKIRVIPVLVDGARTPKADKLPDSVKPLVRRNAVEVRKRKLRPRSAHEQDATDVFPILRVWTLVRLNVRA